EVRSNAMPDDGRVITFADITERVHASEALEQRVEERTAELTKLNTQLEKARADAVEINAGKTRFIAAASHDILQPLNAARLFTSSLMERTASRPDGQLVRNVDLSLEAVEEILSALLDMSRLDAGAIKPELSVFSINGILNQLRTEFSVAAEDKQLDLTIMPCSRMVYSDRRLIRRILQNLLSNAIKYTISGKVLMGARVRNGRLCIEVHDTGPGIPHDKQELVYREFERLESADSRIQGLGLGLSIVERMARVLRHPLTLKSEPGSGCLFRLDLPLAEGQQEAALPHAPAPVPAAASLAGLSVLVVDNEPAIIDGMSSLLKGWGCRVKTATSADAVRKLAAGRTVWPYDAVLMDYHLGSDNGLDLIDELRDRTGVTFSAALITAERSADVQAASESAGVAYLRKPVRPAVLRTVLMMAQTKSEAAE
ncbi:MAG: NahK/ErcS family hybrid sensor histidine kinase/response regulator, partial [Pseudomonadota bacterium]